MTKLIVYWDVFLGSFLTLHISKSNHGMISITENLFMLDILYLNVVGIGGFKYWLTIIEHKSHHPLYSSLKLKNNAADDIIVAVMKLKQQCDTCVKIIQCDGAGEFIGKQGWYP